MQDYGPATYGDRIAEVYDTWYSVPRDTSDTVDRLAELAAGRRVLELGIGSGRVALPLAQHGLEVTGIDASEAMIGKLREKPGGADLLVYQGDFAEVDVTGTFGLIYVVFNTFFALTTQDAQVRCFERVAGHLESGGLFVLEAFVPDPARYRNGQQLATVAVETDLVALDAAKHDAEAQTVRAQHIVIGEWGVQLYPVHLRYAWPSELDLMARLAGLQRLERWSGWRREPFTAQSSKHVTVYQQPSS